MLLFGGRHWNISSSLQLMGKKLENNQEADTSIIRVHLHVYNNTGPDPELIGAPEL